jgi:hypothetical protein
MEASGDSLQNEGFHLHSYPIQFFADDQGLPEHSPRLGASDLGLPPYTSQAAQFLNQWRAFFHASIATANVAICNVIQG